MVYKDDVWESEEEDEEDQESDDTFQAHILRSPLSSSFT